MVSHIQEVRRMGTLREGDGSLALDRSKAPAEAGEPSWAEQERPTVVAEIMSDGTVQVLDRAAVDQEVTPWGSGVIGGPGWTLWWERRRWA
jgi:hypothetical protein